MAFNLFGFTFQNNKKKEEPKPSFAPPSNEEGAIVVDQGSIQGVVDLDGVVKTEIELITKYREIAQLPEVDGAVSEIVNEAIVTEEYKSSVAVITDKLKYKPDVIAKIQNEFDNVLNLLDFNNEGQDIFRRWYVDGRLYYHIIIDEANPREGIQELRFLDPRTVKPVIETESSVNDTGTIVQKEIGRYFSYNPMGQDSSASRGAVTGQKITWDSICYVHSGIKQASNSMILGHIHKAMKPANMLTMVEDATVIYRLCLAGDSRVRTPEGYRYISEIRAGDKVYSFTSAGELKETTVLRQWCNGEAPLYRVASKHHEIFCTQNHPVLAREQATGVVAYVEAQYLGKGFDLVHGRVATHGEPIPFPCTRDSVSILKDKRTWADAGITGKEKLVSKLAAMCGVARTRVRNFLYGMQSLPKPVAVVLANNSPVALAFDEKPEGWVTNGLSLPSVVTPEFARLFGFLIGDGSVSDYRVTFAAGTDADQNDKYVNLMRSFFENCDYYPSKARRYSNYTTSNTLAAELLREMGFMTGAKRKRIPAWVFNATQSVRQAFIAGLCDADGCIRHTNAGTWFCTLELSNKRLVEDVKELWTSLGLNSGKITHRKRKGGHNIETDRTMVATESWAVTLTSLELPEYEPIIKSQVTDRIEEVFDIEVDDESQNFIVNGIVSHNSRAPERRVFYIDVGSLPKQKAEEYMKQLMARYRNKMVYDVGTGEIREDKKFLSFMEDYWLPRREGGRGTEIDTLKGGENLGEMADVEYFREKLYQSLNVPVGRLKSEGGFSVGRATEITRDEIKFGKFVYRLRNRFSQLFDVLLSRQLMLKGIVAKEDWNSIRQSIFYDFLKDTYFEEMKDLEILRERLMSVDTAVNYVGKYYSHEWIRRAILRQTEREMQSMDSQMTTEKKDPRYQAIEAMTNMGMVDPQTGESIGVEAELQQMNAMDDQMDNQGQSDLDQDEEDAQNPKPEVSDEDEASPESLAKHVAALWR